jgi:hypothetical protein
MTFMARTLGYLSRNYNSTFVVTSGTGTSPTGAGGSSTITYYGWCPYTNGGANSIYLPDSTFGSLNSGAPTGVNGLAVTGIWEGSGQNVTTVSRVMIGFAGSVTPVVNSVSINGTIRTFSGSTTTTSGGDTIWVGTLTTVNVASLFGSSGNKTVILT